MPPRPGTDSSGPGRGRTSIDDYPVAGVRVPDPAATQKHVAAVQGVLPAVPLQAPHKVVHPAVGLLTHHLACRQPGGQGSGSHGFGWAGATLWLQPPPRGLHCPTLAPLDSHLGAASPPSPAAHGYDPGTSLDIYPGAGVPGACELCGSGRQPRLGHAEAPEPSPAPGIQ